MQRLLSEARACSRSCSAHARNGGAACRSGAQAYRVPYLERSQLDDRVYCFITLRTNVVEVALIHAAASDRASAARTLIAHAV